MMHVFKPKAEEDGVMRDGIKNMRVQMYVRDTYKDVWEGKQRHSSKR